VTGAPTVAFPKASSSDTIRDVSPSDVYFDTSAWGRSELLSGGSRLIPILTPSGEFRVWTRRVGNNPSLKVLLLHGGPGASSEMYEPFDLWFPKAGIEYYHYDQLGSFRSDQPDDPSLWELERFVDEVEQVRVALGLDSSNFVLFGQSWGGLLALEYALAHQQHLKGLVVSNMVSSVPLYQQYASEVIMPAMDQGALAQIKRFEETDTTEDPRYLQLLVEHHYVLHVCRMPYEEWPESLNRAFAHLNPAVYVPMQGPSELGTVPEAKLYNWDRSGDLGRIAVPTLTIGATHDTMDPEHMRWMSEQIPHGRYLQCGGGHVAQYDDPEHFFTGLVDFLQSL
jgi:proline iminopeptidase